MKSIYITGIAGMLGSNIAYILRDIYHIYGADLNEITIPKVQNEVFSLFELDKIKKTLIKADIDILIHCAALVNVDECESEDEYAYKINVELTRDLANICNELGIKMVFISTDAVFDGLKEGLYSETDVTGPISVYGKNKLEAEQVVALAPNNLIVRTNIYGYNIREKRSFGEWILHSLLEGQELNMFYDIHFSPILVNDIAHILDLSIKADLAGLYHLCSTGSISKYDIALKFKEVFKTYGTINRISSESFKFKAPRTKNMGLSNDKIKNALGITIRTPEEGVVEFKRLFDSGYSIQLKRNR